MLSRARRSLPHRPPTEPVEVATLNDRLIAYSALAIIAIVCVRIGCRLSLGQLKKGNREFDGMQQVKNKDAYMFPIIASSALVGFFILFRILGTEWVNLLLKIYFGAAGVVLIGDSLAPPLRLVLPTSWSTYEPRVFQIKFPFGFSTPSVELTALDMVAYVFGAVFSAAYSYSPHWILSNVLASAFAIEGIKFMSLGSFQAGFILLAGLFVYDIFWVFRTNVMVTVAKGLRGPIKLVFPKVLGGMHRQFAMLGLGDVVVPGVFIAMMYRIDCHLGAEGDPSLPFKHHYYNAAFAGYVIGLLVTMVVMHVFQAAQPALLYIVPACLGSVLLRALVQRQFNVVVNFVEPEREDPKKKTE